MSQPNLNERIQVDVSRPFLPHIPVSTSTPKRIVRTRWPISYLQFPLFRIYNLISNNLQTPTNNPPDKRRRLPLRNPNPLRLKPFLCLFRSRLQLRKWPPLSRLPQRPIPLPKRPRRTRPPSSNSPPFQTTHRRGSAPRTNQRLQSAPNSRHRHRPRRMGPGNGRRLPARGHHRHRS